MQNDETAVVNIRKEKCDVYIGRGSRFGNPFAIGVDGNRKECIEKYEFYMRQKIKRNPELLEELKALKGKRLGCFCKPMNCYGHILIALIKEFNI